MSDDLRRGAQQVAGQVTAAIVARTHRWQGWNARRGTSRCGIPVLGVATTYIIAASIGIGGLLIAPHIITVSHCHIVIVCVAASSFQPILSSQLHFKAFSHLTLLLPIAEIAM